MNPITKRLFSLVCPAELRERGVRLFRKNRADYSSGPARYTERLAEAEISVGSVGDAYDNALAESIIGLKAEVINVLGPCPLLKLNGRR